MTTARKEIIAIDMKREKREFVCRKIN